jgi:sugar transferase (PEP-CTERM/EpsH1 system associated)
MANILFLVHRMPYPPDKGDKARSFHMLQQMAQKHHVYLGTFIDDPAEAVHIDTVRSWCADLHVATLHGKRSRLASLRGLATGEPLTLPYYRDAALGRWVRETAARVSLDTTVVFSSSMAQYAALAGEVPALVDFVDVDSAKWTAYASNHPWPLSWLYRREGRRLLAFERAAAAAARHAFFVTDKEVALFLSLAPEAAGRVSAMPCGVDANYFAPDPARLSPFDADEDAVVFTGAMDYWPNVDAVSWFAREALPVLRRTRPRLRFHIVGRTPAPAVQALAGEGVVVTGTVPDVRPYLQHAAVVVAPLRLARGIQSKILDAMAMARPVVAAQACVDALDVRSGAEILAETTADGFAAAVQALLDEPDRARAIGQAGRERVLQSYTWASHLAVLEQQIDRAALRRPAATAAAAAGAGPAAGRVVL